MLDGLFWKNLGRDPKPTAEMNYLLIILGNGEFIQSEIYADRCYYDCAKNNIIFYLNDDLIAFSQKIKQLSVKQN